MLPITHLDGADVIVMDALGRAVPAVVEVRIEPGMAVVAVNRGAHAWLQDLLSRTPEPAIELAIRSRDGQRLHHFGAVRVVGA